MYNLLNDLSIVEVSSFVASPTAGLYCAQMGAEVIRVDHKAGGLDYNRYMLTPEGRSLSWENLNRAKKSLALDLQSGEGRELLVELAARVGQCITNLPEQSFLAHAKMQAQRADMVSLRIMGWHDGRQAMDFTVNAAAGYPLMCGPEDWDPATAPPVNQVLPAWDFITGAYSAFAMLAALHHRGRTGERQRKCACRWAMSRSARSPIRGRWRKCSIAGGDRERLGNAIWGAFGRDFPQPRRQAFHGRGPHPQAVDAGWSRPSGWKRGIAALEAELGVRFARRRHAALCSPRRGCLRCSSRRRTGWTTQRSPRG